MLCREREIKRDSTDRQTVWKNQTKTGTGKEGQSQRAWKGNKEVDESRAYRAVLLPVESSCRPTSKDSLSVCDLDVFKQARYCGQRTRQNHKGQSGAVTHTSAVHVTVIYWKDNWGFHQPWPVFSCFCAEVMKGGNVCWNRSSLRTLKAFVFVTDGLRLLLSVKWRDYGKEQAEK